MCGQDIIIRRTQLEDMEAINGILNYFILNSNYNMVITPKSMADTLDWYREHEGSGRYVSLSALTGGQVCGYACLSKFRAAEGYDKAAELSIYVHKDFRHRGIGDRLMAAVEDEAAARKFHNIISVVVRSNEPSVSLHFKWGYEVQGCLKEAGYKNGRYMDALMLVKRI